MRSLQTKQPPAVRFTYQGSPSRPPNILQIRSQSVPKTFAFPEPPQPPASAVRNAYAESSHIKVVDEEERRERRRRIFEEVGALARSSKSRERNRSFSIFNGARENTNQVKELVMSKESCKEQSAQTDIVKEENKISNFMQSPEKAPVRTVPQLDRPIEYHKTTNFTAPPPPESLRQELTLKEKELAYLKLELERHERCERITFENEQIYKRLVDKLDSIHEQSKVTLQRSRPQKSKQKSPSRASPPRGSPPRVSPLRSNYNASSSETTRFMHPSSAKCDYNRKEVLANVLNKVVPEPVVPAEAIRSDFRPEAVTFYRQDHRKTVKGNRSALQVQACEEELRERLEQSVRRYATAVSFDEVPMKDKLSSMNRHLENKYTTLLEQQQSRAASHSRYTQRGRSVTSTVLRSTRPHLLL